jgi:hypothetical protein
MHAQCLLLLPLPPAHKWHAPHSLHAHLAMSPPMLCALHAHLAMSPPMLCATMLMRLRLGWAATSPRTSSASRAPHASMPSYVANLQESARQKKSRLHVV